MKTVLWFLSLLLIYSCIDRKEISENSFDMFQYYSDAPEFAYTLTNGVTLLETLPKPTLTPGTTWKHYNRLNTITPVHTVTLDSFVSNIAYFRVDANKYIVAMEGAYYRGVITEAGGLFDEEQRVKALPFLHWSERPTGEVPIIRMDNGTAAIRIDSTTIYSTYMGRLEKSSCLISYNGSDISDIAILLREFLTKEEQL